MPSNFQFYAVLPDSSTPWYHGGEGRREGKKERRKEEGKERKRKRGKGERGRKGERKKKKRGKGGLEGLVGLGVLLQSWEIKWYAFAIKPKYWKPHETP